MSRAARVVFTTSPELQASHRRWNEHTYFYGNVADFHHFNRALQQPALRCPESLSACQRPRLLFTGAIDAYKVDLPLLLALALQRPDWSFVLVGPIGEADPSTDVADLKACANVYFCGSHPYADLPAWAAHADVALLPLRLNGYTRNMFPMKFLSICLRVCLWLPLPFLHWRPMAMWLSFVIPRSKLLSKQLRQRWLEVTQPWISGLLEPALRPIRSHRGVLDVLERGC